MFSHAFYATIYTKLLKMNLKTVKFSKEENIDFVKILRQRVNEYFKTNNISSYGNTKMVVKTIFMILLFFTPYAFIISGTIANPWIIFVLWIAMGIGAAGIGLAIMHDANHGAYSKNKKVNNYLGYLLNLIGGNSTNWKIQHNVLHHSFTNVDGLDEDINGNALLRFSPHKKRRSIHRFQYIYAWFFYSLMTVFWMTAKEFLQLKRFKDQGLTKRYGSYGMLLSELIIWKVIYFAYVLVLPLVLTPVAGWVIVLGFVCMHFVTGLILSSIFQPAHVMPSVEYPLPDDSGNMENNWAIHQILTTTNFAPSSRIFSWFVGGLNYQIEHHLFPNICHIHYKNISEIVKSTAHEYNLPYHTKKSFLGAIIDHTKMLRSLGRYDFV